MNIIKIGDKVKVVGDRAGHGIPLGTVLTVRNIRPQEDDRGTEWYQITVKETTSYLHDKDVALIYQPSMKPGKIIITDPALIIDEEQYAEIQYNHEKFKEPDYEHLPFPVKFKHKLTGEPITIHYIESTPYGNGEYIDNENQPIIIESGLICIAEKETDWLNKEIGAKFDTLQLAKDAFPGILNRF